MLVMLSRIAQSMIRTEDIFARYGGEEFTLILPDTDLARAQILAGR